MSNLSIEEAVHEAGVLLRADGADLLFLSFDSENNEVSVLVDLTSSGCADCIIPPELLSVVISDAIIRGFGSHVTVKVDDPRS